MSGLALTVKMKMRLPSSSVVPGQSGASPSSAHYAAVRQLFEDHHRSLIQFLLGRLNSEQEAIDVAQEAYVRLLQLHQPETVGFLRGYLFKIAANLSIDRIRHNAVRAGAPESLIEELADAHDTQDAAIDDQALEMVCSAVQELPERVRRAFVLRFIDGLSSAEIAREMRIDERTVRKFLSKTLAHCRARLNLNAGDPDS